MSAIDVGEYEGESFEVEYADQEEQLLAGKELDYNSLTQTGKQAMQTHVSGHLAKLVKKNGRTTAVRTLVSQHPFLNTLAMLVSAGLWGYVKD